MSGKMKVWWRDEFVEYADDEARRNELAWPVPDEKGIFDPTLSFPCTDVQEAAEKYADYFHSERDGWENTWPVTFVVFDGEQYYDVEVERETVPEFHAARPVPR